jgi:putative PIN family toxin of toxin-antitoxin system
MKIVLDTNGFVAVALAIVRGDLQSPAVQIFTGMGDGRVVSLMTDASLYEIAETLQDPRFQLPIDFRLDFIEAIATVSEFVPIRGLDMGCRDDDDDRLVETAINGRAEALVTRDKDLLDDEAIAYDLKKRGCALHSVHTFAAILEAQRQLGLSES